MRGDLILYGHCRRRETLASSAVTLAHLERDVDGQAIFDIIADDLRCPCAALGARRRPADRRDPQIFSSRQPREHVDPRGGDDLDRGADDGRL